MKTKQLVKTRPRTIEERIQFEIESLTEANATRMISMQHDFNYRIAWDLEPTYIATMKINWHKILLDDGHSKPTVAERIDFSIEYLKKLIYNSSFGGSDTVRNAIQIIELIYNSSFGGSDTVRNAIQIIEFKGYKEIISDFERLKMYINKD